VSFFTEFFVDCIEVIHFKRKKHTSTNTPTKNNYLQKKHKEKKISNKIRLATFFKTSIIQSAILEIVIMHLEINIWFLGCFNNYKCFMYFFYFLLFLFAGITHTR